MLPLLVILLVPAAYSANCSYSYEGRQYTRTPVVTIKGLPTNLVYNPVNKELLFTLIDLETLQDDYTQTKMDQYLLRGGEPIKVDNINGQSAAVDSKIGRVYIASDDGLHVLNESDKANFDSFKDEDIVQLFKTNHNDDLYAVFFPDNELYMIDLQTKEKKKIEQVPCAFILAVDDKDNIFYECDSKYVKVLLKGFQEPIEFVGIAKNAARALAIDSSFKAVLATNDGLYHLRPDSMIPSKMMDLDFIPSGLAFERDNFYLATSGLIYKYSTDECKDL